MLKIAGYYRSKGFVESSDWFHLIVADKGDYYETITNNNSAGIIYKVDAKLYREVSIKEAYSDVKDYLWDVFINWRGEAIRYKLRDGESDVWQTVLKNIREASK